MNDLDYDTNKPEQADAAEATVVLPPKKYGLLTIPKKKSSAVVNAVAAQAHDPLLERVHVIENYDKDTAIKRVLECEDKIAETYFEMGGALSVIRAKEWFKPYKNFDQWVEGETEMQRSKARALIQIYDALANSELPWSKVNHLGWTKLRRIAGVLTQDNADHWIEIASKHSRSKLIELVKQSKAKHNAEHPEAATTPTHKWTFTCYPDQNLNVKAALEKAKKEANTDVPSEAFSLICIDYLGTMSLVERLKKCKLTAALAAFNEAFPDFVVQDEYPDDDPVECP